MDGCSDPSVASLDFDVTAGRQYFIRLGGVFGGDGTFVLNASRPITCPCDLNGDGLVDLIDLATLLGHFGQHGAEHGDGDIVGDGIVDLSDLAMMLGCYGLHCQ